MDTVMPFTPITKMVPLDDLSITKTNAGWVLTRHAGRS